jgi:hypothetical protein
MAGAYQHASDYIPGHPPFSGVITAAGKWVAVQAESQDWVDYQTWAATEGNVPDPYLHPAQGGVAIVLGEGQVPYGVMLDSIPDGEPVDGWSFPILGDQYAERVLHVDDATQLTTDKLNVGQRIVAYGTQAAALPRR